MANATAIAIQELTANGSIAAPAAQTLDTGAAAVTLETADAGGAMDSMFVEVTNTALANLVVTIEGGEKRAAFRRGLGDVASVAMAQNARRIFGPFESARFAQDGKLRMTFAPASGTISATFAAYRLPKV